MISKIGLTEMLAQSTVIRCNHHTNLLQMFQHLKKKKQWRQTQADTSVYILTREREHLVKATLKGRYLNIVEVFRHFVTLRIFLCFKMNKSKVTLVMRRKNGGKVTATLSTQSKRNDHGM